MPYTERRGKEGQRYSGKEQKGERDSLRQKCSIKRIKKHYMEENKTTISMNGSQTLLYQPKKAMNIGRMR